jgi:hypothetical protein
MTRALVLAGILVAAVVALVPAAAAANTNVQIGINIGAPPQFVAVPGSPVYYAPALPLNYFHYGGQYYLFHNGTWLFAPTYNGPWAAIAVEYVPLPILRVPVRYYNAPPGHWKKKGPPPWAPAWGHRKKWKHEHD